MALIFISCLALTPTLIQAQKIIPSQCFEEGFQFSFVKSERIFSEAQLFCQQLIDDDHETLGLASINSFEKNQQLTDFIISTQTDSGQLDSFWIGVTRPSDVELENNGRNADDPANFNLLNDEFRFEDNFASVAGEAPWLSGAPENNFGDESCVFVFVNDDFLKGVWSDFKCDDTFNFVCEQKCNFGEEDDDSEVNDSNDSDLDQGFFVLGAIGAMILILITVLVVYVGKIRAMNQLQIRKKAMFRSAELLPSLTLHSDYY